MISLLGYEWKEIKYNKRLTEKIKQDYQLSSLISKIIVNRKFNSEEIYSIKHNVDVLNPFLKDTDFLNAKKLILEFIKNKKKILIIGDYDVDGSVSTALLINFLIELITLVIFIFLIELMMAMVSLKNYLKKLRIS